MALSDVIADVQAKALTMSGIKAAPTEPPEAMSQFPFSVCYARRGEMKFESAGFANYLHTIVCEIHCARLILPKAVAQAMAYIELFASKILADPKLSNTVQAVNAVRYEFGNLTWAAETHIGIRFEIDVKLSQT